MTTLTELETLVIEQTKRPDIPAVTSAAIRSATLRAHHVDFFPRDLSEGLLSYAPSPAAAYYSIPNISTPLARLRSLKFVQCVDSVTAAPVERLEYRDMDDLYDSDGNRRQSVYTLLGDTLRVAPVLATGSVLAFFYANPNTAGLEYSSWIADTYPDQLALWAAAIVFARTGYAELADNYQRSHIAAFKETLISSHLLGNVS